jgi:hypothetical protein
MKKHLTMPGNLRAVAAALFFLLAFPTAAGAAVGFDSIPVSEPEDPDKCKAIIEDADPVGSSWRGDYIPGSDRTNVFLHDTEDPSFFLPDPLYRLPAFVWAIADRSLWDLFDRNTVRGAAGRDKWRD